ncbi:serine hydrolase domain-containing protein [Ferdinandcohnia quinoae]|uniref:Beta-lactamase family protein n=1 Tax=Fredinandcohnia quinoae TaxID=2918902 RepID=A0AAW5E2B2_9BACI|nr:serine hydrolase domain-containing protein [Fredinandcohnia sp. SECRCQ15]MCH1627047.1 beta-lactamase family protein [Fredinandcohnia sp. SECRCQ15]
MKDEEIRSKMENHFRKMVRKDDKIHNAYLLVHSEKHGIHLNLAVGSSEGVDAHPEQPFLIASITKLFTAVLIGILVEQNKISFEDKISTYLDNDVMQNLHVYKGKDYSNEIRIKHLLNHTSGLNCYFEDKPQNGQSMIDMVINDTTRFWTPLEVVDWSKKHLKSHFPPGQGFHYSDTGYHLLGLIIEKITATTYHEALHQTIFQPYGMNHTYVNPYSQPMIKSNFLVAEVNLGHLNLVKNQSLSINYAGGGIVAPAEDLLIFMKALVNYEILKEETLAIMRNWAKFAIGIDYGYGIMGFKHVPVLMPKKFNMWGNAGSTGTFMFYHPELETYFIGGLNQFRYTRKSFMLMFKMVDLVRKFVRK